MGAHSDRRDGTTINHHQRMGVAAILTQSTGGGAVKMNWPFNIETESELRL